MSASEIVKQLRQEMAESPELRDRMGQWIDTLDKMMEDEKDGVG